MPKAIQVEIVANDKEIPATLHLKPTGFEVVCSILFLGSVPRKIEYNWKDFITFSIEGPEQLQKRVTVTRLLTIGIFAFAKKKKSGESFLFSEAIDGSILILKFINKSEPEVKAFFAPYKNQLPSANSSTPVSSVDLASQIEKLADLHASGALTAEEFASMKAKLLSN
jgi:hypothetical protein